MIVDVCDKSQGDYDDYCLCYRDVSDKTSEPLSEDEEKKIVEEIGGLIFLGYRMKDLACTLDSVVRRK